MLPKALPARLNGTLPWVTLLVTVGVMWWRLDALEAQVAATARAVDQLRIVVAQQLGVTLDRDGRAYPWPQSK